MLTIILTFVVELFILWGWLLAMVVVGCLLPGLLLCGIYGIFWFFNATGK